MNVNTLDVLDQFYKKETNCTCAVPCERVVYEPKLSYAQLSDLNINCLVAGSDNKQNVQVEELDMIRVRLLSTLVLKKYQAIFESGKNKKKQNEKNNSAGEKQRKRKQPLFLNCFYFP